MNTHDKDIDALFRSKLNDLEVEPSAGVYANINHALHSSKPRKSIVPLLRIAASIVIVLSTGLFFLLKDKKAERPRFKTKLVKNQPLKKLVPVQQVVVNLPVNHLPQQAQQIQVKRQLAKVHHLIPVIQPAVVKAATQVTEAPVSQPNRLQPKDSVATAIAANQLTVPTAPISINLASITPDLMITPTSIPANTEDKLEPVKRRKIRSLGGLLNVVIASVDKRRDKIIEFTDTESGASITGINLGVIRIKKEE